jgi:hypothetical protein
VKSGHRSAQQAFGKTPNRPNPRPRADIERMFAGLELLEPGVVMIDEWRGDSTGHLLKLRADGGVGRKA